MIDEIVSNRCEGEAQENNNASAGDVHNMAVDAPEPGNQKEYRARIKTMAIAWCSMSAAHPSVNYLKGLRMETFTSFADYVLDGGDPEAFKDQLSKFSACRRPRPVPSFLKNIQRI